MLQDGLGAFPVPALLCPRENTSVGHREWRSNPSECSLCQTPGEVAVSRPSDDLGDVLRLSSETFIDT